MLAKIGRRRVATGANHPASHSSAFRRGPGTPAGAPTGDQSTGMHVTPKPPLVRQDRITRDRVGRCFFSNRGTVCAHPREVPSTGVAVVVPRGGRSTAAVTGIGRPGLAAIGCFAVRPAVMHRQVWLVGTETLGAAGFTAAVCEHEI